MAKHNNHKGFTLRQLLPAHVVAQLETMKASAA